MCEHEIYGRLTVAQLVHNPTSEQQVEVKEKPCLCQVVCPSNKRKIEKQKEKERAKSEGKKCKGGGTPVTVIEKPDVSETPLDRKSLLQLRHRVKTACEVFGKKDVKFVLRDEEFQQLARHALQVILMDEYHKEEERIRKEKKEKWTAWSLRKMEIEQNIDKCLHVMQWARENEASFEYCVGLV